MSKIQLESQTFAVMRIPPGFRRLRLENRVFLHQDFTDSLRQFAADPSRPKGMVFTGDANSGKTSAAILAMLLCYHVFPQPARYVTLSQLTDAMMGDMPAMKDEIESANIIVLDNCGHDSNQGMLTTLRRTAAWAHDYGKIFLLVTSLEWPDTFASVYGEEVTAKLGRFCCERPCGVNFRALV